MSEPRLSFSAPYPAGEYWLSADDVATLRKARFPDGIRTADDAALLLAIHYSCNEKSDEWHGFFIAALTDFIVRQVYPQGSLDDINVAWLIRTLSNDGVIASTTEFEVLMNVLDVSAHTPPALIAFALDQLRHALGDGVGAYREARSINGDGITRHDLDYIRHVLGASIGASSIVLLSPVIIEALERLDQATRARANHPGWAELLEASRQQPQENPRTRWIRVPDTMFAERYLG
jgi:hypothetical protein